jgi:ABC-type dipeptide/oligopeptide/nickel transport system permease component
MMAYAASLTALSAVVFGVGAARRENNLQSRVVMGLIAATYAYLTYCLLFRC